MCSARCVETALPAGGRISGFLQQQERGVSGGEGMSWVARHGPDAASQPASEHSPVPPPSRITAQLAHLYSSALAIRVRALYETYTCPPPCVCVSLSLLYLYLHPHIIPIYVAPPISPIILISSQRQYVASHPFQPSPSTTRHTYTPAIRDLNPKTRVPRGPHPPLCPARKRLVNTRAHYVSSVHLPSALTPLLRWA